MTYEADAEKMLKAMFPKEHPLGKDLGTYDPKRHHVCRFLKSSFEDCVLVCWSQTVTLPGELVLSGGGTNTEAIYIQRPCMKCLLALNQRYFWPQRPEYKRLRKKEEAKSG